MSIFQFKNTKNIGIFTIMSYLVWGFLIIAAVFFSWIFLFVYRYLYVAIIQESAIITLRSDLVITKVNKQKFDDVVKNFEQKKEPIVNISFDKINNPFRTKTK